MPQSCSGPLGRARAPMPCAPRARHRCAVDALRAWLRTLLLCALAGLLVAPAARAASPLPVPALDELVARGDALSTAYRVDAAVAEQTAAAFSQLYFGVFEAAGLELSLGSQDRARVTRIEHGFAQCIRLALERQTPAALATAWGTLRAELVAARPLIAQAQGQQGTQSMGQALLIVLREGLEAILVVSALAAFLARSGQGHRLPWLWAGVLGGLAGSAALAWWLAEMLARAGARQGLLTGALVLLAALMMAHMASWLYARRSAERWNRSLRAHIAGAADATPWLVAGVALVAVFREGAETILFFQALAAAAPGQSAARLGGAALALLALALIFAAMQWLGRRLPLARLFVGSAVLLLLMALVFAGQGVLQLQLAGALPTTALPWAPTVAWLGLHPSLEGLLTQAALLLLVLLLSLWPERVGRAKPADAATVR